MAKIIWGVVILATISVGIWYYRHQDYLETIAANKRQIEKDVAAAQKYDADRLQFAEFVKGASDAQLEGLYTDCERTIADLIGHHSAPVFAVYFPDYDASDLDKFADLASAMRMDMDRPSVELNDTDFHVKRLRILRTIPGIGINVVAESASDTIVGPKRWAASYECSLENLKVVSASQGKQYVFQ